MSEIKNETMKVLFVASEALPFASTGGLADVIGSLPPILKKEGVDARVVIPYYSVFKQKNLRYFHLFNQRMELLHDIAASLRDYTIQVRDLYQSQLDVRQNHIMAILTIVTTVFTPLTLITGWYGMNFVHMPELAWKGSYPVVIAVSIAIVVGCLWFFKKKKWL